MLVSYKVLSEYVDLNGVLPHELGDLLTNAGLEVEEVKPLAQGSDLVIGYVKEAIKHPESTKLSICQVQIGENEVVQIVCGAPNVKTGSYVIVAKVGCKLDYAKVDEIKSVVLAGYDSQGMICSLSEIGIADKFQSKEDLEGIYVLEQAYPIGREALSTLDLDDYILDISLTPNRSDIYSIYALAIEVAGILKTKVKEVKMSVTNDKSSKYSIEIADEACLSYCLYDFYDVKAEQSNSNIKNKLIALGIKPRFNIVDYGNLAMVISGNPVHTFDADKLKSKQFMIKKGVEMSDFLALDDKEYEITKDDLVIMNGDEVVCIAGVIGSKSSCIDENTTNVIIESAIFDHVSIRNTARRLDLFSEASTRYSKIVNQYTYDFPIACFEEFSSHHNDGLTRVAVKEYQPVEIKVNLAKIERVLGIKITLEECVEILEALSFEVKVNQDELSVYPPSYRKDVLIDVDVIEEIIRIYGYENIKATLPLQEIVYHQLSKIQELVNDTKDIMVGYGLNEIITYQLNSKAKLDNFSTDKVYKELLNPLSEDHAYFRDQLLSNMVETIQYNMSYQRQDLSFFEISNVYIDNHERRFLSLGLAGLFENNSWQRQIKKSDFYLMKGIILGWLAKLGFNYGRILLKPVEADHEYFHPTRSAYLTLNNKVLGVFGQVHPALQKELKIKETYLASIDLAFLAENVGRSNKYEKVSLLPSVSRDLSLVVPDEINAQEIIKVAKTGNNKFVKDVTIFDIYHGDEIEANHYSMALSIKIGDDKKTLTDNEINEIINNIITNFSKKLGISLRQ